MRGVSRDSVSPTTVIALTALVLAIGGSAFAAGGGLEGSDGTVQGCVAQANIVSRVTDGIDQVTNGVLAPVTGAVNQVANSVVDPATSGGVGAVTQVLTPKGSLVVVAPGANCPTGYTPQNLAASQAPQLPEVFASRSAKPMPLGKAKGEVAGATLPAGSYLVNATAVISDRGSLNVTQTVKCVLVGPDGQAIPGTTSTATIPADSPSTRLTLPITAAVSDLPGGNLALDCKNSVPKTASTAARIAAADSPPASNGSIQATQTSSSGGSSASADLHGCVVDDLCIWTGPNFTGSETSEAATYDLGRCYQPYLTFDFKGIHPSAKSMVNNTKTTAFLFPAEGLSKCGTQAYYTIGNHQVDPSNKVAPHTALAKVKPGTYNSTLGPVTEAGFFDIGLYP
jgi:hypothetical protein